MEDSKKQTQFRFLLAATLSMVVLFGWTYFFAPPPKPPADNTNTAQTAANTAAPPPETQQPQTTQQTVLTATPDNVPNRQITIKTPLYQATLDSRGALATSWILLKNKSPQGEKALYGEGSNENEKKPLELIPPEGLSRNPRVIPFRLSTGDESLNQFLNERNYQVAANEEVIELGEGQERKIDFVLRDEATGVEAIKSFTFRGDSYVSDLQTSLTRNGQPVPNTKLLIGASIGDQSVPYYTFYKTEAEAVSFINGGIERYPGAYFEYVNNTASKAFEGAVDWAGVGDAYFAMAAIPSQPLPGLEYHASRYEVETAPFFDGIISWITRSETTKITKHLVTAAVPIAADGSITRIYTGTKDRFAMNEYNEILSNAVGRTIDIEDFINYGWFSRLTKPLAVPILYALNFLYNFTHNYGIAIIVFTFLFYSALFPLRWFQSKSFKKAQRNAPKMKEMQDRLKDLQKKGVPMDDPRMRELQMQQLKMTKDALPIGGCLPTLLQFPLLIALYVAITISLSFRQASFLWLPDLSSGDPYHLLEFGFAISMILSMKFMPSGPAVTPEQQMQQKMMTYLMPVMMLWIMWGAPSGLLLYWFFGNIVMFVQQLIINRINKTDEPPKEEIVETVPKNAKKVKAKPKLSTS
ncbi:MAG TPA: membrane protein insertase YidC [Pyrinomonadaceae bacterium]|nr:membrane protein insertase YidC [Pyrinomonadaceae bacterium]